jgi:hypothetical protein
LRRETFEGFVPDNQFDGLRLAASLSKTTFVCFTGVVFEDRRDNFAKMDGKNNFPPIPISNPIFRFPCEFDAISKTKIFVF